jgi:hypothetical protein
MIHAPSFQPPKINSSACSSFGNSPTVVVAQTRSLAHRRFANEMITLLHLHDRAHLPRLTFRAAPVQYSSVQPTRAGTLGGKRPQACPGFVQTEYRDSREP